MANPEQQTNQDSNPNAAAWEILSNEPRRGRGNRYIQGRGFVSEEEYEAAREAREREQFIQDHPESYDAQKAKWLKGGWIGMTHWYKEHPDEIGEILPPDSEHDVEYYMKKQEEDFRTVGRLVKDYLDRQNHRPGENPEPGPEPGPGENPEPGTGEEQNQVEIGDINVKVVEKSFKEFREEDLARAEKRLRDLQPQLAESYAKNRRLLVGGKNRAEFARIKGEYGEILDRCLRLKVDKTYEQGKREKSAELEKKLDDRIEEIRKQLEEFSKGEVDGRHRTQEEVDAEKERLVKEASDEIQAWYDKEMKDLETKVNTEFVKNLIDQETELETATNNALDNGTFCRRFVSKVLNNRALKGALVAAGVVGLAATGIGLATGLAAGTMAVGFNLTAGGAALGAAKGGLSAALMSRQDSKVSKVRGFASEEGIRTQIGEIDVTKEGADVANVTKWLMGEYGKANDADRSSNRKRTAVSVGIGAAIGALASGLHFDKNVQTTTTKQEVVRWDEKITPKYDASNVDVSPNHGYLQIFDQVQGDPAKWDEAFQITQQVAQKYGVVSDMSKGLISPKGIPELLPGKPSTWDTTSQQFLNEIINEWAAKGCIARTSMMEPVYGLVTNYATEHVKNSVMGYLVRGVALAMAGTIGGAIGDAGRTESGPATNGPEGTQTPGNPTPEGGTPTPDNSTPEGDGGYTSGAGGPEDSPEDDDTDDTPEGDDGYTSGAGGSEDAPEGDNPTPEGDNSTPEGDNPTPETDIPGFESLNEGERDAVEHYAESIGNNRANQHLPAADTHLATIYGLGQALRYPGFGNASSVEEINEVISNLPQENRDRLEYLYKMVLRKTAFDNLRRNSGLSEAEIRQAL